MRLTLPPDDLQFLRQVQDFGDEGLTQEEMAARLGVHVSTFRFRIRNLGFQFTRQTVLARTLSGETLNDLLRDGQIVAAEEAALA